MRQIHLGPLEEADDGGEVPMAGMVYCTIDFVFLLIVTPHLHPLLQLLLLLGTHQDWRLSGDPLRRWSATVSRPRGDGGRRWRPTGTRFTERVT